MIIEKLAVYKENPSSILDSLVGKFQEEGFELFNVLKERFEVRVKGSVYRRIRVDLSARCYEYQGNTLVQIIYSPLLSPSNARPINLPSSAEKHVLDEINQKMLSVLQNTGEHVLIYRENLDDESLELEDPQAVYYRGRRGKGRIQSGVGLLLIVLGSLMSYFQMKRLIVAGSTNFWLILAVLGVAVFCFGLFNMVWRR